MATGWMWDYQVVQLSGAPAQDEETLNQYGMIGYELVAVVAMGGLVAYLKRGSQEPGTVLTIEPESDGRQAVVSSLPFVPFSA